MWGATLVDQLRKKLQDLDAAGGTSSVDLSTLRAEIAEIRAQLAEILRTLDSLDAETLSDRLAFVLDLREQVNDLFATFQEGIDDAMAAARMTALSAIRNGVLGLGNTAQIRVEQQTRLEANYAFAEQIEAMIARIGTAEAAIVVERTVRADGDESFAQQLESLLARVGQAESAIDEERTVRSDTDSALSQLLTTVSTALGGQQISVTELKQSIDGMSARWGVSINSQSQVIGLVSLSGDQTGSQFTIVADKFVVANPTDASDTKTVFGIGEVNGVSTVGIKGNTLIDGSLSASAMSTATLTAIWASITSLKTGIIRSFDGLSYWNLDTGAFRITAG